MEKDSGAKKTQTPADQQAPKGLCTSCNLAAECTFPRLPGRPVMCCEEFDGASLVAKKPPTPTSAGAPAAGDVALDDGPRGLCRTCELKEVCSYPKPEGGVWHCEEFR